MKWRPGLLFAAFTISAPLVFGADEGLGKTAASFLNYAQSARSIGMGKAETALPPKDLAALHANPAQLTLLSNQNFMMTTGAMGLDRTLYSAAYNIPFNWNFDSGFYYRPLGSAARDLQWNRMVEPTDEFHMAAAVGFTMFGVDDIESRTDFGLAQGNFQDIERAISLSYAVRAGRNLAMGFTGKFLSQSLHTASAEGFAWDVGVWYGVPRVTFGRLDLGLAARDLGATLEWTVTDPALSSTFSYDEPIRSKYTGGLAYTTPAERWVLSADVVTAQDQDARAHFGAEWILNPTVALRAGANAYDPTLGFGLNVPFGRFPVTLDYAFQYGVDELSNPHWLTLNIPLTAKRD